MVRCSYWRMEGERKIATDLSMMMMMMMRMMMVKMMIMMMMMICTCEVSDLHQSCM